ncbi:MAG: outer membrane beta-barrel protein [Crocinitomicaceae bacterium]
MYLEDEEIDNLYAEFRNEGVAPPPEAKDFVMNTIGKKSYWKYLWVLLFLIGAGTTVYFVLPTSSSQEQQIAGSNENEDIVEGYLAEQKEVKDIPEDMKNSKNSIVETLEDDLSHKHEKKDRKLEISHLADADAKGDVKYLKNTKSEGNFFNKRKNQNNEGINKQRKLDIDKKENFVAKNVKNIQAEIKPDDNFVENTGFEVKVVKQGEEQLQDQNNNQDKIEWDRLDKLAANTINKLPVADGKNIQIDLRNLKKRSVLQYSLEARVGYSFSDIYRGKEQLNYENIGMFKNLQTFEAEIHGILNFKSFLVKTGIGIQNDFSTTNYSEDIVQYRNTVVFEELLDSNNNPYNSVLYTFADTSAISNSYQMRVSTSYFTLPLQIGYQLRLGNRWNLEILAGTRFGFLMDVSTSYNAQESMDYLQSIDHGNFRKFRMDATLDLGLNYRLNEKWSIGIHLPGSLGLNSRTKDSKILNYRIGGMLNLRFNF